MASKDPETYYFTPTLHVPNSKLPVLVYRRVLPADPTSLNTRDLIEQNHWMQGGVFKTYKAHHFHSKCHECYAVFKGKSKLLLGCGPLDDPNDGGVEVDVEVGDIIVLPAGVSHCSISSEGGYEYVGLYPEGSPHWDNNFCKADSQETKEKANIAKAVPLPEFDPIYGRNGPLVRIWSKASARADSGYE